MSRQPVQSIALALPWACRTFLSYHYIFTTHGQGHGQAGTGERRGQQFICPKIKNIMLLRFEISQTLSTYESFLLNFGFSVHGDTPFHYFLLLLLSMMINKQSGRASVAQKKRWGRAAQNNNCYWGQIWMNRTQKPSENMWHRIIRGKNYRLHF